MERLLRWARPIGVARDAAQKWIKQAEVKANKATLIYRRTKNMPAGRLLLGRRKLKSTARSLVIDVDRALEISEQIEI